MLNIIFHSIIVVILHIIFVLFQLLSYMQACNTYFHQGSDLGEGMQEFLKCLDHEVCTFPFFKTIYPLGYSLNVRYERI